MAYRFVGYDSSRGEPNIVVDGAPNEATVLTLSHWPGIAQPPGIVHDLSAGMAHAFIDHPVPHAPASAVTNNHFDQDGLVAIHALIDPDEARRHRELLVDVASAGDFGVYRDRRAARASMAIAAFDDPDRSPVAHLLTGDHAGDCVTCYEATLPLLVPMATDPGPHRDLWGEEDEALTASLGALERGAIRITEDRALDLAVVDVGDDEPARVGHRFSHETWGPVHPMALQRATDRLRMLVFHRGRVDYVDRYESWVQLRSRTPLPRVDLRPLADDLAADDPSAGWSATGPDALTATLGTAQTTALDRTDILARVAEHLRTAPAAWDPYRSVPLLTPAG